MGKWQHRVTNVDEEAKTGICSICGIVRIKKKATGWRCYISEARWGGTSYQAKYKRYKEDKCSRCGFVPEHHSQLDVDHIDNNHQNNNLSNLQTLCSNCHRLKTWIAHGMPS